MSPAFKVRYVAMAQGSVYDTVAVHRGTVIDLQRFRDRRQRALTEPWRDQRYIAAHFGVTTRTVQNWMRRGLPFSKPFPTGVPRFKVSLCEEWHNGALRPL
jgi:hypothetical protein